MKETYYYDGPVMSFGKCIMNNWKSKTQAESAPKALSNFQYQYKMKLGTTASTHITLPGKITKI